MTLAELRAKLKGFVDKMDALVKGAVDEAGNPRDFTDEELNTIKDLEVEVEATNKQIEARKSIERTNALKAAEGDNGAPGDDATPAGQNQVKQNLEASEKIGLLATALVVAKNEGFGSGPRGAFKALDDNGYAALAREIESGTKGKSMNSSNATAGGVLLPENMAADIIPFLYPQTTFLQGGPINIPMPNGTFRQPGGATGASAGYRGEGKAIQTSAPTLREISMSAKLLGGIVPMSNQLIRWSLPNVRQWAEGDLRTVMATTMDSAAYRGAGTEYTPLGITRINGVYRFTPTASNAKAPTYTEIDAAFAHVEMRMQNLPLLGMGVVMSLRTFLYMQNLRDGNGNKVYPTLDAENPMFRRKRVFITSQVPDNLGGTTDESEIYLVAFGHVLYGDAMNVQLAASNEATIVHQGQTVNMWQDGMTAIKAEMEHDFGIRYTQCVQVMEGVRWGAP